MCDDYDFDGCVRLLGAVIRSELTDARGDPYKLGRIAEWLDMSPEELQRRWANHRKSNSGTYGVKRSDFDGKQ